MCIRDSHDSGDGKSTDAWNNDYEFGTGYLDQYYALLLYTSGCNPICDGIAESHKDRGEESWYSFCQIIPMDVFQATQHHDPNDDQNRCCRCSWYDGKKGTKNTWHCETDGYYKGCQTSPSTSSNSRSWLNISRHIRSTCNSTNRCCLLYTSFASNQDPPGYKIFSPSLEK